MPKLPSKYFIFQLFLTLFWLLASSNSLPILKPMSSKKRSITMWLFSLRLNPLPTTSLLILMQRWRILKIHSIQNTMIQPRQLIRFRKSSNTGSLIKPSWTLASKVLMTVKLVLNLRAKMILILILRKLMQPSSHREIKRKPKSQRAPMLTMMMINKNQ